MPSLNEVISIVRAEEGRRGVMLEPPPMENSTIVSLKSNKGYKEEKKSVDRDTLWCTHC